MLLTFLVISTGASFFAGIQIESANRGVFEPQELTCDEIIESGPGKNRFLKIGDFEVGGFCTQPADESGRFACTYMPIFPAGENPRTADSVNLVLHLGGHLDEHSYRDFWNEAIKSNTKLRGMCSEETYSLSAVEQAWPEKFVDAYIIHLDDVPSKRAYWIGWCAYGVALAVSIVGTLFACWWLQLPRNILIQLGLACAGIAAVVLSIGALLQIPTDVFNPLEIIKASGLLTAVGAGLGAFLAAAASLLLPDRFHSASIFGTSTFDVSDQTLTVTKGKDVKKFNFEDIDCITYSYDVDRQEVTGVEPGYRLDLQSNGKTSTTKGVLEQGQGPILQQQLTPIIESITQRRLQQIFDGQSVTIAGWTLEGDTLSIPGAKKGKPAQQIPLNTLSKIGYVSDHFQIWVKGEPQAVAKYSGLEQGAEILEGVLNYFVELQNNSTNDAHISPNQVQATAPSESTAPTGSSSIGLILFEDEKRHMHPVLIAIASLAVGIPVFYYFSAKLGLMLVVLGLCIAFAKIKNKQFGRIHFCLGEQGVSLNKKGKTTAIRYDALNSFAYQLKHVYNKGTHVGDVTTLKLKGTATDGTQDATIDFVGENNVPVYTELMSKATEAVAMNLTITLSESPQVDWVVGKSSIHRDGIEALISSGMSKSMERVGFERIGLYKLEKDTLFICIDDDSSPKIKIDAKAENFYPGFYLFEKLLALHQSSAGNRQAETVVNAVSV